MPPSDFELNFQFRFAKPMHTTFSISAKRLPGRPTVVFRKALSSKTTDFLQREKERPFEGRSFPSPSAHPHLFPKLSELRFRFSLRKNKSAPKDFKNQSNFSTQPFGIRSTCRLKIGFECETRSCDAPGTGHDPHIVLEELDRMIFPNIT